MSLRPGLLWLSLRLTRRRGFSRWFGLNAFRHENVPHSHTVPLETAYRRFPVLANCQGGLSFWKSGEVELYARCEGGGKLHGDPGNMDALTDGFVVAGSCEKLRTKEHKEYEEYEEYEEHQKQVRYPATSSVPRNNSNSSELVCVPRVPRIPCVLLFLVHSFLSPVH